MRWSTFRVWVIAGLSFAVVAACRPAGGSGASATVEVTSEPSGAQLLWFPPAGSEWFGTGAAVQVGTTPATWSFARAVASLEDGGRLVAWVPGHGRAEVALTPAVLAAPIAVTIPRFGSVRLGSDPIARFTLLGPEGRERASDEWTPLLIEELEPGNYTVQIERPGYAPYQGDVRVMAATQAEHLATLQMTPDVAGGSPRVEVGWARIEGALDVDVFYGEVMPRSRELGGCYDRALAEDPGAGGQIALRMHVSDAFGSVSQVEVLTSDIANEDALDCFTRRLGRAQFPPGTDGTTLVDFALTLHRVAS